MDAGGPRTAAAEQGHAAAHSCGSLRGHACGGGADPQYQRQTAGATVDAPTAARRVGHARRLVPTPAHAAKVHKPAWASTQKRGQLPMRWSSESGKKTCSQVDASTEAGFMHSYVVGHIGLDPSQPSILRNGDRGRRESSRQVTTPYRSHASPPHQGREQPPMQPKMRRRRSECVRMRKNVMEYRMQECRRMHMRH